VETTLNSEGWESRGDLGRSMVRTEEEGRMFALKGTEHAVEDKFNLST
jgi:hypothetical protein